MCDVTLPGSGHVSASTDMNRASKKMWRTTFDATISLLSSGQHHHIFSFAIPKRHHILVQELHISTRLHLLSIQFRAIRAVEINQVRLDFAQLVPKLVRARSVSELDHRMLLRYTGML